MKKITFLLLILVLFATAFAQKKSPAKPGMQRSAPNNKQAAEVVDSLWDIGYETIKIFARINTSDAELEVKVNGRIAGRYTQTSAVTLDGFLAAAL